MFVEIFLFLAVIYLIYTFLGEKKNLPPGPWRIPYLGFTVPLKDEDGQEMARKYGDIFTCHIGAVPFVLLADFKLSKELFSMPELSNRPKWRIFASLKNNRIESDFLGLISSNGLRWQHNRRFTLRHLRDLGMGKSRLEDAILFEVAEVVKYFKLLKDEPTEIPFVLNIAILNVIWQLVATHRFDFEDKRIEELMKHTNTVQATFLGQAVTEFYPFVSYIMPKSLLDWIFGYNKMVTLRQEFYSSLWPYVEEHKKTLDPDSPRDFIDDYLIAMEEKKNSADTFFEDEDLMASLVDLFIAGNDTVANSTKWMILYMAKYQSIQKMAQEEIDKVVPRDTLPNLEHRPSLPYIDALVNEVLRVSSFLNFGVSRCVTNDIKVRGYDIPKDTVILTLAGAGHNDSRYWKDPQIFDPERFIDSNGKLYINKDGHQPFGLGRRQCLGEPLARMELYLLAAALLQNFTFAPPPGEEVNLKPKNFPFFHWPQKQKLLIKQRN